jgi:hypothetical protein
LAELEDGVNQQVDAFMLPPIEEDMTDGDSDSDDGAKDVNWPTRSM